MNPEFRRILAPLDGSGLAEAVVPWLVGFAGRIDASLILLHVLEKDAPSTVHGQPHLTSARQAEAYLEKVAARCVEAGVKCRCHVHSPPIRGVAAAIADHAAELDADLIAMTTHGSGGLRELLLGSIAQQTLSHGRTSVLLVRPSVQRTKPPAFSAQTVVVAVEPATHGLAPLGTARRLGRELPARLHLVTVVPDQGSLPPQRRTVARFSPRAAAAALDLERRDAERTLREAAGSLEAEGLEVSVEVRRGDPMAEVASTVREQSADLLVIATHGRTGLDGWLSGSFAAGVTHQITAPLLLLRIPAG